MIFPLRLCAFARNKRDVECQVIGYLNINSITRKVTETLLSFAPLRLCEKIKGFEILGYLNINSFARKVKETL